MKFAEAYKRKKREEEVSADNFITFDDQLEEHCEMRHKKVAERGTFQQCPLP